MSGTAPERGGARPIVHVGPTKTASTWLQEVVFPRLDGIEVLGRKAVDDMNELDHELLDETWRMIRDTDGTFEPGRFAQLVAKAEVPGSRVLVADEGLLSTMRYADRAQLDRTIDRLRDELPDAQIVVVVRNPVTLIASTYRHYVRRGGTLSLERFCRAATPGFTFCRESFDMAYLYDLLISRFGSASVVPLLYEELAADPRRMLQRLTDGIGVAADPGLLESVDRSGARNASLSMLACEGLRQVNRLFASRYNPGGPVSRLSQGKVSGRVRRIDTRLGVRRWSIERRLDDRAQAILTRVGAQYARSHVRLADATGLDLRGHGYPWPA